VSEASLEEFVFSPPDEAVRPARRREPILGPTEFAISLKTHVDKVVATCPLSGHGEVREIAKGEKIRKISNHFHVV
jgi:hypothetical protein